MTELWISPFVLWMVFAVSIPSMAIVRTDRHRAIACWLNGFICAIAIFTTFIVATARF